jgi:hypothetical protein
MQVRHQKAFPALISWSIGGVPSRIAIRDALLDSACSCLHQNMPDKSL